MKRSFKISLFLCILLCSCYTCFRTRYLFDSSLSEILGGIKKVDIEDKAVWAPFVVRDPYTIEIYTLSAETVKEFEDLKVKRLELESYEEDSKWKKFEWHKTPVDSVFEKVLWTATGIDLFHDTHLMIEMNQFNNIVQQPGSYYAFYYLPFTGYEPTSRENEIDPVHVCFFLLDTYNKKIFILSV